MLRLTLWAGRNIIVSRLIIIVGLIILYFLSSFFGFAIDQIFQVNIIIWGSVVLATALGILIYVAFSYPEKSMRKEVIREGKGFVRKWKVFDLGLVGCMCLLGFHFGFHMDNTLVSEQPGVEPVIELLSFAPTFQVANVKIKKESRIKCFIDKKQMHLKTFFTKIVAKVADRNYNLGVLILHFLWLSIVYFGLFYVIAFFYCQLSCGGSPTVAIILLIVGNLLILGGLIYAIYTIKNRLERNRGNEPDKRRNLIFSICSSLVIGALTVLIPNLLG